ncbi:MAG TPA: lipid-binding SYLF domain-containing protein [Candidatus Acidoferrum sp.]|nr:lipid-binding SYLF domain-containing protein [Candidatus Acidoferrum sp.]
MRKLIGALLASSLAFVLLAPAASAQRDEERRLRAAGTVIHQILTAPDDIPRSLLDRTKCVVVLPSVVKGAFVVGGSYGRGAMVCRTGEDFTGPWGAPAMYALEGISFGFQAGGQATDFVLLIMNEDGVRSILKSKVKLGGDVTIAAGPIGRAAEADTDAFMRTQILSYSRSRGVFAGVSLEGATLHPDNDADDALYGQHLTAWQIVRGPESPIAPRAADFLVSELEKASPRPRSA